MAGRERISAAFLLVAAFASRLVESDPSRVTKRRIARIEGDIILGALFPVHYPPSQKSAYTRTCGKIWEQYGMHRIEMFFLALDEINADPYVLPNITLGCDIRDSCWYSPVALEQSIDFIKDSIATLNDNGRNKTVRGEDCDKHHQKPIAGLIGPGSSTSSIQVQNLLQIFHIPQIGYSATSTELSDKSLYKYFVRVVPPDRYQARAMLDIVLRHNWTYVSAVHTEGSYGSSGMEMFKKLAKKHKVCIATSEYINSNADRTAFDALVRSLKDTMNARVIVCFCEGMTVKHFFQATRREAAVGHFLVIGSDGWATRPDVVKNNMEEAAGGISIKLHSPQISYFDEHFQSLKPDTNKRNPWFREFWQEKFHCYLPGVEQDFRYAEPCTGEEKLVDYQQDAKLGFVRKAIYAMANALHSMQQKLCGAHAGMCASMERIVGSVYFKYLLNVSFTSYSGEEVHFDANGDPPGRYDIMNFQKIVNDHGNVSYEYAKVGSWNNGALIMNKSAVYWPGAGRGLNMMTESVCSKPCKIGHVKKNHQGGVACCWTCTPCKDNEILLDETTCKPCSKGWWPNTELTACLMIPIEHMSWHHTEAIVAMAITCVGILSTLWVFLVFIRHNDTPVVKASTRELSYIILLGITTAFSCNFALVAKPSIVTCYFTRILPGLSFALIYGSLVTKTNRIARILEGSKKIMTKKPRFMSASAQVVISCILIGIESAIITIMLIIQPADSKFFYPTNRRVLLVCNTTAEGTIIPLGFDLVLIFMCTLYAIKTRNLPENFNEAKFIGFTMYTTCIIWMAFVPIYFESESKVITMCVSVSLSASVALVLLFFPKVYIIIWAPEKNTRSAFKTSKDVRCHIGNTGRSFSSSDSMDGIRDKKSIENLKMMCRQRTVLDKWKQKGSGGRLIASTHGRKSKVHQPSSFGYVRHESTVHSPKIGCASAPSSQQKFAWSAGCRVNDTQEASVANVPRDREIVCNQAVAKESNSDMSRETSPARRKSHHTSGRHPHHQKQDTGVQTDSELLNCLLFFMRAQIRSGVDLEEIEESFLGSLQEKFAQNVVNNDVCSDRKTFRILMPSAAGAGRDGASVVEDRDACATEQPTTDEKSPLLSPDGDGEMTSLLEEDTDSGKEFRYSNSLREIPFILKRRRKSKPSTEGEAPAETPIGEIAPPTPLEGRARLPAPLRPSDIAEEEPSVTFLKSLTLQASNEFTHSENIIISGPSQPANETQNNGPPWTSQSTLSVVDESRRQSAFSGSSSSGNLSLAKSLEELSLHGLRALDDEELSMERFIAHLYSKGVWFDISSVQSSDV